METVVMDDIRMEVRVFPDLTALSRAAAEFFGALSKKAIAARGGFSIAISGGSTPLPLYTLLGSSPWRENIDWKHVHVFWADERCVPPDHRESNFKLADDTFIARAAIPDENIHRIDGEIEADQAALKYEQELRAFFGAAPYPVFDLVLLGVGEDGHTASLFPGNAVVQERERFAVAVHLDAPRLSRVTLTLPVLNHAAEILFLVSGGAKAGVVQAIAGKNNPDQYPAGFVHPTHGAMTWFVDAEAAVGLSGKGGHRSVFIK
jgi:6-phosphogluconolactonase